MVGTRTTQYEAPSSLTPQTTTTPTAYPVSTSAAAVPQPHPSPVEKIFSSIQDKITSHELKAVVDAIITAVQLLTENKDQELKQLQSTGSILEKRVVQLEDQLDDVSQYERRDTVIISGPDLPQETGGENPTNVVVDTIKRTLNINITPSEINVAHRLGTKNKQTVKTPIIVKLHSRQKKDELLSACVTVKPNIFINESLTPKRRSIFKTIWNIRKQHRDLFQQCYTRDGKICVKLRCSNQKHTITSEWDLNNFLDKFPALRNNAQPSS